MDYELTKREFQKIMEDVYSEQAIEMLYEYYEGADLTLSTREICELIPDWQEWTEYRVGEHVVYEGTIYRVVQSHRSQHDWLPPHVPTLYTVANKTSTDPVDSYPEWVQPTGAHDAYSKGDLVTFEGKAYESLMDGNTWSPTDHPAGWQEIEG